MEASDAWRQLAFGEMRGSHGLAFSSFIVRGHPGFGRLGTQVVSADPSSSSSRPLDVR
jgi:hypothetical protein